MPGSWTHLAARFFDVVGARALTPAERSRVDDWLEPTEIALFLAQHPADQRHGFECGVDIEGLQPARRDLIRAALLHDVGKRHARLGPVGRVVASVIIRFRLPRPGRVMAYAHHGELAAIELSELGAEKLVCEFARHHHGSRPGAFPESEWNLLLAADRARLPGRRGRTRYAEIHGDGRS